MIDDDLVEFQRARFTLTRKDSRDMAVPDGRVFVDPGFITAIAEVPDIPDQATRIYLFTTDIAVMGPIEEVLDRINERER